MRLSIGYEELGRSSEEGVAEVDNTLRDLGLIL